MQVLPRSLFRVRLGSCRLFAPLALAWSLVASTILWGCAKTVELDSSPLAKSVVLVCIDTLRADHVGIYGYGRETTPRIDRLASEGALFERTISQSNWTVPATATLLTSLYPSEHGAMIEGDVRHLGKTPPSPLRDEVETLGDLFHGGGFRTGLFSANPYLYGRFQRGFDIAEVEWQSAESLTDKAIAWLGEQSGSPFFIHLQYMDLHQPIEPPEPYFSHFEAPRGGPRGPEHSGWSHLKQENLETDSFQDFRAQKIALYDGALRYVDAQVGRLVDTLEELSLLNETLLVITSDHGEEFWDHAEIERDLAVDPRGFWGVGHGHSMFQELLRVPLVFRGPSVPTAARVDCPARLLDVAPTMLELVDQPSRPRMRGVSLAPLWAAAVDQVQCGHLPQVAESTAYGPDAQAIVWKRQKLIVSSGFELLFDLRADSGERDDLSGDRPKVVRALRELLAGELAQREPSPEGEEMEYDPETERQLRALGYLGG